MVEVLASASETLTVICVLFCLVSCVFALKEISKKMDSLIAAVRQLKSEREEGGENAAV
jgi:hypothetical protein